MNISKFNMYCISLDPKDLKMIKSLGYIPTGLGMNTFSDEWATDFKGENISHKNKWYSELTFHYWYWKNCVIKKAKNEWVGFCAYRDFWANEIQYKYYLEDKKNFDQRNKNSYSNIQNLVLNKIPEEWNAYDVILGNEIFVDKIKFSKLIKYGKQNLLKNPKAIFKKNRTIEFHFNMFHGQDLLRLAIEKLEDKEKNDFLKFVSTEVSFNRGCMFISKSNKLIENFYNSLFPWLERCEEVFGFKNDKGYETRIYAFLAERYMSYWFKKYSKFLVWPIISFDIPRKS